ncbi:limbic system-associated membrane protein-like [Penaeus vannamei]|uniref:limbic system-associated membrane protein-like n=1 Tax=Penaeus vannamei TaxID=6689 RepID=UPI00387F8842
MTELPPVTQTRFTAVRDPTLVLEEEEPYFDMSMSPTQTAYLGKTATLTCVVHAARNDKSVSWIRGRDLRILTVGGYTYTTDLRFEAFHQPHSTEWTLRIKSVQLRDQGGYECQIATKPIRTYIIFLRVEEPSVEVVGAPDIFVNRASMINLTCVVYHAPYPPEDIIWYHGNQVRSEREMKVDKVNGINRLLDNTDGLLRGKPVLMDLPLCSKMRCCSHREVDPTYRAWQQGQIRNIAEEVKSEASKGWLTVNACMEDAVVTGD